MAERPRIAHVGIAVPDLEQALPFYRDVLGLEPHPPEWPTARRSLSLPFGDTEVELLAPAHADRPSPSFWPAAAPASITSATGFPTWTRPSPLPRGRLSPDRRDPSIRRRRPRIAFVHPKATAGILLELTE